jgi:hypothetical protein
LLLLLLLLSFEQQACMFQINHWHFGAGPAA